VLYNRSNRKQEASCKKEEIEKRPGERKRLDSGSECKEGTTQKFEAKITINKIYATRYDGHAFGWLVGPR